MAKFQWERNNEKERWEIVYYGRKIRKPIFECKGDRTKTESYWPIRDHPQASLCGGGGKSALDGKDTWNFCVWRDIIVEVIGPKNPFNSFGPIDASDVRIIIRRLNKENKVKEEIIYIGLPPETV